MVRKKQKGIKEQFNGVSTGEGFGTRGTGKRGSKKGKSAVERGGERERVSGVRGSAPEPECKRRLESMWEHTKESEVVRKRKKKVDGEGLRQSGGNKCGGKDGELGGSSTPG